MKWESITLYNGEKLSVHAQSTCSGFCAVHNPSDHPLNQAPLAWNRKHSVRFMERVCWHKVHHPDPDGLEWAEEHNPECEEALADHECCGCCVYEDSLRQEIYENFMNS